MGFKVTLSCFFSLLLTLMIVASPYNGPQQIKNKEIVGQATNIITSKILKGGIDNHKNSVFSPFGYATILAILSEGTKDETNHDILTFLKHPEDRADVRSAYHSVLKHLQGMEPTMTPQFRSWFYIYKNNTIDESFKKLISDEYFVSVRDVERLYVNDIGSAKSTTEKTPDENPSMVDFMDVQLKNAVQPSINNSKDIVELDTFKLESGPVDETRIDNQKDASKFDEVVEDRQYVDDAAIKEQIKEKFQSPEAMNSVVEDDSNDGTTVQSMVEAKKTIEADEKSTLPLKQLEEMEIMRAEESRVGKAFGNKNDDGASILSGNSIIGEKENAREDDPDKYEPKMLIFNGLYYRGNWASPFQHLRSQSADSLFYTNLEPIPIKMMKSCGYFRYAKCDKYNSEAIEFPYENERYSMLVLYPSVPGGLKDLINNISSSSLNEITSQLEEELIDVSLPRFEVETTSGAEKILAKEGLASLFTSKADFGKMSTTQKLRIGELQQHVTFRVDEGSSTENFLTATGTLRSNAKVERSVVINRPFLFFVRDRIDDVIIVAGKITELDAFQNEPEFPNESANSKLSKV